MTPVKTSAAISQVKPAAYPGLIRWFRYQSLPPDEPMVIPAQRQLPLSRSRSHHALLGKHLRIHGPLEDARDYIFVTNVTRLG